MEAGGLSNLGLLFAQVGFYDQAIELYSRTLEIAQETDDKMSKVAGLSSLGIALLGQGKVEQAEVYCEQAVSIVGKVEYPQMEAAILVERGRVAQAKQAWAEALELYTRADQIWQSLEVASHGAGCQAARAFVLWQLGQKELAQEQALLAVDYMLHHDLTGYWSPMTATLNIYYVLAEVAAEKAQALLAKAHESLMYQAAEIVDEGMRDSFLHGVAEHRVLRQLYEAMKLEEGG